MFNPRLEALRGIAALMVALGHSFIVVNIAYMAGPYAVHYSDLHGMEQILTRGMFVIFNGGAAVSVFFVLSGYVLGLSLNRKAETGEANGLAGALGFMIKRLLRLFPAHIASLTLILISLALFHEHFVFPNASSWFTGFYRSSLSVENIIDNYLLLESNLNPVTWTLQVELLMSLLFPLAFVLCRSLRLPGNLIALLVIYYFCAQLKNFFLLYSFMFYSGLIISQINPRMLSGIPRWASSMILGLGLVLLLSARLVIGKVTLDIATMECIGAVLIILVLANRLEGRLTGNFLDKPWARMLGRVSYSFYVLHFIVLYWLAYLALFHVAPAWVDSHRFLFGLALAVVSIPLALILAHFSFEWVEKPFIRWGSDMNRKFVSVFSRGATTTVPFSFKTLLGAYPGVAIILAMIPLLYLAQGTQFFGRSGIYLPMNLEQHDFAFSDFMNFHVLALAYPLSVAMACLYYLMQPGSFKRWLVSSACILLLGIAMIGVHFFTTLGMKGLQIFDVGQSGNFMLAWLSAYGTVYYVVWSMLAGILVTEWLGRCPSWLVMGAVLSGLVIMFWGPGFAFTSELPYLFAPWSPLNAFPVASIVVCMHQHRDWLRDKALPAALVLILVAIGFAVFEWTHLVSAQHGKAQLAALPTVSRVSLIVLASAILLLAIHGRLPKSHFFSMLARSAGVVCLIYPVVVPLGTKAAASLAVNQSTFQHWTLALSFVALYTVGFVVSRIPIPNHRKRQGRNLSQPDATISSQL